MPLGALAWIIYYFLVMGLIGLGVISPAGDSDALWLWFLPVWTAVAIGNAALAWIAWDSARSGIGRLRSRYCRVHPRHA